MEQTQVEMEETTQENSHKRKAQRLLDSYVAQCGKCYKWRSIDSQEEYEEIRSETPKKSFECENCEEPGDVDLEHDSGRVWFMDKHGIPKTPQGFKRVLVLRESFDKADAYYLTPQGKRLKCPKEVTDFIQKNQRFKDIDIKGFSFVTPKVMKKNQV